MSAASPRVRHGLLALALVAGAACAPELPASGPRPANGESWRLFQGLQRCRGVVFHVPLGSCVEAAGRLAQGLEARGLVVAVNPEVSDGAALRILAGVPSDPTLAPLAQRLGVVPLEQGFTVLGHAFTAPGDALVAVLEDPERAGRPLCLALGNDLELLAVYLDEIPSLTRPHLRAWADGEPGLECPLELSGAPRTAELRDYLASREELLAQSLTKQLGHMTFVASRGCKPALLRPYGASVRAVRKRVARWFGRKKDEPVELEVFLYSDTQQFERCLGTLTTFVANRLRPRVHVLVAEGVPDDAGRGLARVLARALAGSATEPWIAEGLEVAATSRWWGTSLQEWTGHLASGGLLPPGEEVLADDAHARWSEHALLPARALLFERLTQAGGATPGRIRALWKGADADTKRTLALYARALTEVAGNARKRVPGQSTARRRRPGAGTEGSFRRGIALLASDERPYSCAQVGEALDAAARLEPGPNAVQLSVLAAAEDPAPCFAGPARASVYGSSSDLALACAAGAAAARDLRVLLALEVLAQPACAWADNISWSPQETEEFFQRYTRVALHYALLGELLGVDVLSFGANLRESTRTEPRSEVKDPVLLETRRAGWKRMIQGLRGAYGGGLTLASRLPGEAAEVGLFGDLDYVSVFLYPRVQADGGEPTREALVRALRHDLMLGIDLAVRWNKPLLVQQIGFPARADSWSKSQLPAGAVDLEAQRRFYEALADVLASKLENGDVLRGFYLWGWPVDERLAGPGDGGFSPRGKPAEEGLRRLFAR